MTFLEQLQGAERQNGSLLCVGLDPEPGKFPASLKGNASKIYDFCAQIVDATCDLASGRAAILGYTMPIFSAVIGALVFKTQLSKRNWGGISAAAIGVIFLLWHELDNFSGKPFGVLLALGAASSWALGTQLLRRTTIPLPTLTLSFWMTVTTAVVMTVLATVLESDRWEAPTSTHWASIIYNAILVFVFAHSAWFYLARSLPPVASTLSVMMIPILGVFSGALALNELLHWQDWAAMGLMVVSIASVLWPTESKS